MAYRIDPAGDFSDEVKSVASDQLHRAIMALETQPDGLHEAIHEARKKFKRVRALYRLVADDMKEFRQAENVRLRQTAADLSAVRDATALIETVDYLSHHAESPEEEEVLARTRDALTARRDAIDKAEVDLADKARAAIDNCNEAIAAASAEDFDGGLRKTAKRIRKAWKKSLTRARAALSACHENAHAEVFHELRKCGQTYWMHLSLLRDIWPSAMHAKRQQAKHLVDMLGHEHDMSLLVELLDAEPGIAGNGESQSHLLGAIIRQQQAIRRETLPLAETVFADEPSVEAGIVAVLWIEAAAG